MSEYEVQILRSDPETQFTEAIPKQQYELETLTMPRNLNNAGEIIGVNLSATQDLTWVVWFFTRSNGHANNLSIENVNAEIVSATTIGKNSWAVNDDQYNGYTVEIYGGTGVGQERTITDTENNSGNGRLTVATWDTTPSTDSDFRVHARDPVAGQVTMSDCNPLIFAEEGTTDALYRWENRDICIPYVDEEESNQIYVAVFNDEVSTAKANYAGGGRLQVQVHFRPYWPRRPGLGR